MSADTSLSACADRALDAFRTLCGAQVLPGMSGADLLAERAALDATGADSCRLLPSADGVVGLNLPRQEDWELVPAWLQLAGPEALENGDWDSLRGLLARLPTATLVERGRLLGLAVVDATRLPGEPCDWLQVAHRGPAAPPNRAPRVVDLSSLWAGPLCSRLWLAAGAEVIKVESTRRPDGARNGSAEFFRRLNQGKQEASLELHTKAGREQLRELIRGADIVLEASRPRALRQMGIIAEDMIDAQPGLTWLGISGYGRAEPEANWIAYGDDAAIAAGLSAAHHARTGRWEIVGDAIADPLTGLHAALAGWRAWRDGGGQLLDIALERTVRHCLAGSAS